MKRPSKRGAALLTAGALLGGVAAYAAVPSAEAIPGSQETCAFGVRSITPASGWQPIGLPVSINNGSVSRKVITQLSADMGVTSGAEIRVGYRIDAGPIREKVYGPGNLANHTQFWQTRNALAVMLVGSGSHRITPYWRISGGPASRGWFEGGCFTAEGRTS